MRARFLEAQTSAHPASSVHQRTSFRLHALQADSLRLWLWTEAHFCIREARCVNLCRNSRLGSELDPSVPKCRPGSLVSILALGQTGPCLAPWAQTKKK